MIEIIGVRFKSVGKVYYFSPGEYKLASGDKVIVETARGVVKWFWQTKWLRRTRL